MGAEEGGEVKQEDVASGVQDDADLPEPPEASETAGKVPATQPVPIQPHGDMSRAESGEREESVPQTLSPIMLVHPQLPKATDDSAETDEENETTIKAKMEAHDKLMQGMLAQRLRATVFGPITQEITSNTVLALIVSHWDPVRGPTSLIIMESSECKLKPDELSFLGKFALLSAVGNDGESQGISFTSLPELKVAVSSALFKAHVIKRPQDPQVQYCLSVVVNESVSDRFVYLSHSVNDRLTILIGKLQSLLKEKPEKLTPEGLMEELNRSIVPFLVHLDTWMAATIPPDMPISQTLLDTPVEKDFFSAVVTAHLTNHQRTTVRGSDPSAVNRWLRALILVSSPEAWQLSQLMPEKKEITTIIGSPFSATEEPLNITCVEDVESLCSSSLSSPSEPVRNYVPDLYLQGVHSSTPILDADIQLSRFPSCIVDIDNASIWACRPLNEYSIMRSHNMTSQAVPASAVTEQIQCKRAACVKELVSVLFQIHPSLRAGFMMEWRRWYFRKAAAVVQFVHHASSHAHDEGGELLNESFAGAPPVINPGSGSEYLTPDATKQMKALLDIPTDADLDILLSAAETLCPGTYSKVCGNPVHFAFVTEKLGALGIG